MDPLIVSISGLRGIIGASLTPDVACDYGKAFGTYLKRNSKDKKPKIAIGRDSRPSGSMISAAVSAGLMACGCDIVDLGIVSTPGGALMGKFLNCDGAVIITASHNPVQYNGIKLLRHDGIAFPANEVKIIQDSFRNKDFDQTDAINTGNATSDARTHAVHVDTVMQLCDTTLIKSKRFKVVLDSVNGAGCIGTSELIHSLGCELIHINERPTGLFAHTPEPTAENLKDLGPVVTKYNAIIGFAQDPDADRLALIDEKGNYIGEEYTLALAAKYIFSKKKGKAAANLSTSRMIDDLAAQTGCEVIRTAVGEAHVANAMVDNDCIIGGEGNGGVIDLRVIPVRDSFVGIVMILQLIAETGKTVSQLVAEIPKYEMIKTKFEVPADKTDEILSKIRRHFDMAEEGVNVDTTDGIRIDMPMGWVHLRASNTEPIMRLIAEAKTLEDANEMIEQIRVLIA